jgi:predicted RNA binding protein YcfA (HicA-like mRNA interferase family)
LILGFIEVRQRGTHKQFRHGDGRCTTVGLVHDAAIGSP